LAADKAPASYYQKELENFGFKPGEWTLINKQNLSKKDPFFASNIKLTPFEKESLQVLSQIHQKGYDYKATSEEIKALQKFFAHIYQNKEFNQRIHKFIKVHEKNDPNNKVFNPNVLYYLREF